MKIRLLLSIIFVFTFLLTHAQKKELSLAENVNKETISFQFIKNLVIVPITFNGHQMNFIVDSGLKETILFSQYDETINKNNLRQVNLKGLGKDNIDTKGFFSSNNQIEIGKNYSSNNMDIIVIQDENFNLFSRLGLDVHGIIGADFFKNHPIQIDYAKRKITIYKSILEVKNLKKFQSNPLEINPEIKPFTTVDFTHQTTYTNQKMLIDIGNSDGLWLFENQIENLAPLQYVFSYELGKGFNGSINLNELDTIAKKVGIGAVIFWNLSENRIKDQVFSLEEALNFNGETGPYVQYMAVRTNSVLNKVGYVPNAKDINLEKLCDNQSIEVIKLISDFQNVVINAMEKNDPSFISRYLIDLAQAYSSFYNVNKIICDDKELQDARLYLTYMTKVTLTQGLNLLGISVPEKM